MFIEQNRRLLKNQVEEIIKANEPQQPEADESKQEERKDAEDKEKNNGLDVDSVKASADDQETPQHDGIEEV